MDLLTCSKTKSGLIMSPQATISYPNLFTATPNQNGKMTFNCTLIFERDEVDLTLLKELARETAKEKWRDNLPKNLRSPFRDGEEKMDAEGYGEGRVFCAATGIYKPSVRSADNTRELTDEEGMIYPGCKVRATLTAYTYDNTGNVGVAFGLRGIQWLGHGDPLGGGGYSGEDDFDAVETPKRAATKTDAEDIFG